MVTAVASANIAFFMVLTFQVFSALKHWKFATGSWQTPLRKRFR
jgi:hypothetical protein